MPVFRSVRMENSTATGRIFMKCYNGGIYQDLSREFTFGYNLTKITSTVYEDLRTFISTLAAGVTVAYVDNDGKQ